MSIYAFTACLFLLLVPALGAAELHIGQREVDPAVPHRNAAEVAPGIRLVNGSFTHAQLDLATAGRVMGLSMRRVYRSDMQFDGPLGKGWTCEYLQAAWRDAETGDLLWHDADGFLHIFVLHEGAFRAPPGVYVNANWDEQAETVSLRRADGTRIDFNPDGQLAAITDRDGNGIALEYDADHRLASVTDDRGFCWEFEHDAGGRIIRLIDRVWQTDTRDARSIEYEYDADGRLLCVKLPETARYSDAQENRVCRRYAYDADGRLAQVIDPNQAPTNGPARIELVYDADGRVVSFRDGDANAWHRLRYTVDANGRALVRHLDPRGVRADYTLDNYGRTARHDQYTGFWEVSLDEPLDHAYVAQTGVKLRAGDPPRFTTRTRFNRGHQLTRRESPGGAREDFSYPSPVRLARGRASAVNGSQLTLNNAQWEAGAFAGGFLRMGANLVEARYYEVADNTEDTLTVVAVDLAQQGWSAGSVFVVFTENPDPLAAGNLLEHRRISSDPDQPDIVRDWSYEPYFQQVRSETSARGFTTSWEFGFDQSGDPGAAGAGCVVLKRLPPVTVLLPDGTSEQVDYETHYSRNQYGQLTETVDPQGGVESRSYHESGDQAGFLHEVARGTGSGQLIERFEYDKTGVLTGQYPPAAFDNGTDPEAFKLSWQLNELGQRWRELGPVAAGEERAETCRYYDPSGNEVRTWRKYVTAGGQAPAAPADYHDPNSFGKEGTAMAATWAETVREFDLAGRLLSETSDAVAATPVETVTWSREYDALGNCTARVSPLLKRTAWSFDERGLQWRRIEGAGSDVEGVYEYDYDLDGRVAAERTPLGNATLHAYDGHGREVSVTDPTGNVRGLEWDDAGNLLAESCRDAEGAELARAEWGWDELDRRCLQRRLANDAQGLPIVDGYEDTRLTLDGRGAIVAITDAPGRTWLFEHDAAGRLVRRADPTGNEMRLSLNAAGLVTQVEYRDFNQLDAETEVAYWQADYGPLGLPAAVRDRRHQGDSFDTEQDFEWDGWGRLVTARDAADVEVANSYDLRSRLTGRGHGAPGGAYFHDAHEWDRDDLPGKRTIAPGLGDPGQVTSFAHDARGRLTGVQHPDESSVTLGWDTDSNLTTLVDETGTTLTHSYDPRGLLIQRDIVPAGGTAGATRETWLHDAAGRLLAAESRRGDELLAALGWSWNTLHRAESHTLTIGSGEGDPLGSWTTGARHDAHGAVTLLNFSDGNGLSFGRDLLSRTTGILDASTEVLLAQRLWAGPERSASISYGNGVQALFSYDPGQDGPARRVAHLRDGQALWGIERRRDTRGLPVRERREHEGGSGRVWQYDELRRVTATMRGADLSGPLLDEPAEPEVYGSLRQLALDAFGNRVGPAAVRDLNQQGDTLRVQAYTLADGDCNRYAFADGRSFAHDAAGRVSHDGAAGMSFVHDYRGRTVSLDGPEGALRKLVHDALGRRVLEEEYDGETLLKRTVLVYGPEGDQPVEEIVLDAAGLEVGRVQYARDGATLLAERAGGAWRYRHEDQDGSLLGLTDESGARVVEYDYQPFGAPIRRGILYDLPSGATISVQAETPDPATTRIQIAPATLTPGALAGHELAISLPGGFRGGAVLDNTADSIDVHDPQGLVADALLNQGARFLVYRARLSSEPFEWSYDSDADASTFSVAGAGFSPWLLGGWLTPDLERPTCLEIIEVDPLGEWLKVRGNAAGLSGPGARYRAVPPVGADEAGYDAEHGERYLFRGWRHDRAQHLAGWPVSPWFCRLGSYDHRGRRYDPRVGRWAIPAEGGSNRYAFAPWGSLETFTAPSGAPGCCGTWSPSPACPAQAPMQPACRCVAPARPGWSG
jgi:YD repeat-containing protein